MLSLKEIASYLMFEDASNTEKNILAILGSVGLFVAAMFALLVDLRLFALIVAIMALCLWASLQTKPDDEIKKYDDAYYNEGEPLMSDDDYDEWKRDSDCEEVGAVVIGGTTHETPMRSLRNAIDEEELRDFFTKIQATIGDAGFIVEPKIDGLALNVTYSGGLLVSAVTRGDGVMGKDVTENMRHILPESIKLEAAEIRGEVYLSKANFKAINKGRVTLGQSAYKTCQSAAVATLMKESVAICKARKIKFVAYDMGYGKNEAASNQSALVEQLKKMKFSTLPNSKVRTFDGLLRASKRMFSECKLPCDGAVMKLNDFDGQDVFGATKQAPNHAIAWKGCKE